MYRRNKNRIRSSFDPIGFMLPNYIQLLPNCQYLVVQVFFSKFIYTHDSNGATIFLFSDCYHPQWCIGS